jgi:hypothetical protein
LQSSQRGSTDNIDDEFKANDPARPQTLSIIGFGSEGVDCKGDDEKAISKEEVRP